MFKKLIALIFAFVLVFGIVSYVGAEEISIDFLHAMSGSREEVLDSITNDFNEKFDEYHVELDYAGTYIEVFTQAQADYAAGNPPHILLAEAAFQRTLIDAEVIVPAYEIAEEVGIDFDEILLPIRNYYEIGGEMYGLPFNSSTAILFYNKDVFEEAGLDPDRPPKTFDELDEMARQIQEADVVDLIISATAPVWTQLENQFPYHGLAAFNMNQGHDGFATETYYNNEFGISLIERFVEWAEDDIFEYEGRRYEPVPTFIAGESAFLFNSVSTMSPILEESDFEVGTAFLPRKEGYPRGISTIGGGALFAFIGHSDKEYEAVMEYFGYLMEPEVTSEWHKGTGYFPITNTAVEMLYDEGWFEEYPQQLTGFLQLLTGTPMPESSAPLVGNFADIRSTLDAELENAFIGNKTAEEALNDAAELIETMLLDYKQMYE